MTNLLETDFPAWFNAGLPLPFLWGMLLHGLNLSASICGWAHCTGGHLCGLETQPPWGRRTVAVVSQHSKKNYKPKDLHAVIQFKLNVLVCWMGIGAVSSPQHSLQHRNCASCYAFISAAFIFSIAAGCTVINITPWKPLYAALVRHHFRK